MNAIDPNSLLIQMRALAARAHQASEVAAPAQGDFNMLLTKALSTVNQTQQTAQSLSTRFEQGDVKVDLSQVMIAAEKANVSFQALTQVRNKLVTAYQEIMSMPI